MSPSKKLILLAGFLFLSIYLSSFIPLKNFKEKRAPEKTLYLYPTATPLPEKSFQSRNYNYGFRYPANWELQEWDLKTTANLNSAPNGSILQQTIIKGDNGHLEILVWNNLTGVPTRTWLNFFRHEDLILKDVPPTENSQIATVPAINFTQNQTSRNKPLEYFFLARKNFIYEIVMEKSYVTQDYPAYRQILESFTFDNSGR